MIELEHSPLGGSAASRFLQCEFSFLEHKRQLIAGEFLSTTTEFAEIGTGAHELGALCLIDDTEPYEHVGETFNGYRAGFEGEIGLEAVAIYVAYCRGAISQAKAAGLPYDLLIEQTIKAPEVHRLLKGTVDFGIITPAWAKLIDYKNGEGVGVSVAENAQLLYYAFLMCLGMSKGTKADYPIELVVVQPNFYGIFEAPETWQTTYGYVMAWGYDVLLAEMISLDTSDAEGEQTPGDWCQFCPVILSCGKMQRAFTEYANAEEDFIMVLTDEELDHFYSQRENAMRFKNALERVVYARKVTGAKIPSAKLVEKQVARVWKPGAQAVLEATFGAKAFTAKKILSPAGIEKLSTRGKELAKEYGYKPEGGQLTVAPLSDRRAEAKPTTNEHVFAAHAVSYEEAGW